MATLVTNVSFWDRKSQSRVSRRVRVEVDMQDLAQSLGGKAYGNKSKVAKEVGGVIRVYAVDKLDH
jgi:hypothetical protein